MVDGTRLSIWKQRVNVAGRSSRAVCWIASVQNRLVEYNTIHVVVIRLFVLPLVSRNVSIDVCSKVTSVCILC